MHFIIGQTTQPVVEGEPLPLRLVRAQLVERDTLNDFPFIQVHVGAVDLQVMIETAEPDLQSLRVVFKQGHRLFDEARTIEIPVILAMEHPDVSISS